MESDANSLQIGSHPVDTRIRDGPSRFAGDTVPDACRRGCGWRAALRRASGADARGRLTIFPRLEPVPDRRPAPARRADCCSRASSASSPSTGPTSDGSRSSASCRRRSQSARGLAGGSCPILLWPRGAVCRRGAGRAAAGRLRPDLSDGRRPLGPVLLLGAPDPAVGRRRPLHGALDADHRPARHRAGPLLVPEGAEIRDRRGRLVDARSCGCGHPHGRRNRLGTAVSASSDALAGRGMGAAAAGRPPRSWRCSSPRSCLVLDYETSLARTRTAGFAVWVVAAAVFAYYTQGPRRPLHADLPPAAAS